MVSLGWVFITFGFDLSFYYYTGGGFVGRVSVRGLLGGYRVFRGRGMWGWGRIGRREGL